MNFIQLCSHVPENKSCCSLLLPLVSNKTKFWQNKITLKAPIVFKLYNPSVNDLTMPKIQ